jgi:hypothetical protein
LSPRLQSISHSTTVVVRDLPVIAKRLGREVAQAATDLVRAWLLEAAIWKSGSDPSLQSSLKSLLTGLEGARWGREEAAIRRMAADPACSVGVADLEAMAAKLARHRGRRVASRIARGMVLGTARRAALQRFPLFRLLPFRPVPVETGRWPELRPTAPGTRLWYLMARSAASSGVRALVLESQSRSIEQGLMSIASEFKKSSEQDP